MKTHDGKGLFDYIDNDGFCRLYCPYYFYNWYSVYDLKMITVIS